MNSLRPSFKSLPPSSADAFRKFAADPANERKIVVDTTGGFVRGADFSLKNREADSFNTRFEGHHFEMTFPSSDKGPADIVNDFTAAIEAKYDREIPNWVFPSEMREHALKNGLSPDVINTVFCHMDCDELAHLRDQTRIAATRAATTYNVSESKNFARDAKFFADKTKEAATQFIKSLDADSYKFDKGVLRLKENARETAFITLKEAIEAAQDADRNYRLIGGLDLDTDHATKVFEPLPLSRAEAGKIISAQEQEIDNSPIIRGNGKNKNNDVLSPKRDDVEIPKEALLTDKTKIFNEWTFLKLDIKNAEEKSKHAWVRVQFNKEYGDVDLSHYRKQELMRPFEAARKEQEELLWKLRDQLATLEKEHPFLLSDQAQRQEKKRNRLV